MTVSGYEVLIQPLGDEGFEAVVPALPGCSLIGDTPEEAAAGLPEAIDGWIAMARKLGHHVPEPQYA